MPYVTEWVDPELVLEHNGVHIWHTYKDDDVDQGRQTFWFTLDPECGDQLCDCSGECANAFDVRGLRTWTRPPPASIDDHCADEGKETIRRALVDAIDQGLLHNPAPPSE